MELRGARPVRALRVAAASLAAALLAGLLVPTPTQAAGSTDGWQSGLYVGGCDTTVYDHFASWRKAKAEHAMIFLDYSSWSKLEQPTSSASCFGKLGIPLTVSVAMFPPNAGYSLESGAVGSYDSHWVTLARNLVAAGQSHADIRIGWEFNGDWFDWNARSNPTAWKAYWVRIVKAMRSVSGQRFTFTWSPGNGSSWDPGQAWPGDAYVDYVGQSLYDSLWGRPSATPQQIWDNLKTAKWGLDWQARFAAAHGKKIAYPEWGLCDPASFNNGGGGDNYYFIQQFHAWLDNHDVAYEVYFNRDHAPNTHRIFDGTGATSDFARAAGRYVELFGGPYSTTSGTSGTKTRPAVTTPPPPSGSTTRPRDTVLVSRNTDRTPAAVLAGSRLATKASVYVLPTRPATVRAVRFFLDDPKRHGKPFRVDRAKPFDFAGGGPLVAKMFRFGALTKGTHTVTAVVVYKNGTRKVTKARFTR